ncbi:hypothetical protein Daus18300_005725 [Diaporthe australafricana]|uniref:Uncharacterized protein n=1 Tax=Diaporthe australafricana TaxID=127596 RepID=A0ABR3WZA4_9PEZI
MAFSYGIETERNRYAIGVPRLKRMRTVILILHLPQDEAELNQLQADESQLAEVDPSYETCEGDTTGNSSDDSGIFDVIDTWAGEARPRLIITINSIHLPKQDMVLFGPKGLSDDAKNWTESCIELNPNYHAEFLTDTSADQWVKEKYAHRPDILESYSGLLVERTVHA